MAQITIKEIAKKSGVGITTVSKVINKKDFDIRTATRDRVLEVIREYNYQPNYLASSLRSGKRNCIGVAGAAHLDELGDIATARTYAGIGRVAEDHQNTVMFLPQSRFDNESLLDALIRTGKSGMVDGLIIFIYALSEENFKAAIGPRLREENIPFAAVYTTANLPAGFCVAGFNVFAAGQKGAAHLADQGIEDIFCIGMDRGYGRDFIRGYGQAMKEKGLAVSSHYAEKPAYHAGHGYTLGKEIIKQQGIHKGYVIYSDSFAYGFIRALEEAGARVPGDTAVVGCDDLITENESYSGLTTLTKKFEERGAKAAEFLFERINDPEAQPRQWVAEPELIVRESSIKPIDS